MLFHIESALRVRIIFIQQIYIVYIYYLLDTAVSPTYIVSKMALALILIMGEDSIQVSKEIYGHIQTHTYTHFYEKFPYVTICIHFILNKVLC